MSVTGNVYIREENNKQAEQDARRNSRRLFFWRFFCTTDWPRKVGGCDDGVKSLPRGGGQVCGVIFKMAFMELFSVCLLAGHGNGGRRPLAHSNVCQNRSCEGRG